MGKSISRYQEPRLGSTSQKILLLLLGGLALGLSGSPIAYFSIIKAIGKEWEKINNRALHKAIKHLYKNKLIDAKDNTDHTTAITLTDNGNIKALTYQIDEVRVLKMRKWDKKWRVILFDIPEKQKKSRNALARILKNAGFYQFQKSVFVHPFECKNEMDFVIEFFSLRPYVRIIIAEHIDNELHLKKLFDLI